MATTEADDMVEAVNKLSNDAAWLMSRDWFRGVLMNKPILAAPQNDRQETAFRELMAGGFAYLDTERGVVGYRSTERGRIASGIAAASFEKPAA